MSWSTMSAFDFVCQWDREGGLETAGQKQKQKIATVRVSHSKRMEGQPFHTRGHITWSFSTFFPNPSFSLSSV